MLVECCICLETRDTVAVSPCCKPVNPRGHHAGCCDQCMKMLCIHSPPSHPAACPLCRATVEHYVVFLQTADSLQPVELVWYWPPGEDDQQDVDLTTDEVIDYDAFFDPVNAATTQ
jgi:hypothetical protein